MEEKQGRDKKIVFTEKCNCIGNNTSKEVGCSRCFISTEESYQSRRCFMTGEYCSKQTKIQRERREQYEKKRITAFVIMNFSDMSNVVYKWRLLDYIESLKIYFAFSSDGKRIYCNKENIMETIEISEKDAFVPVERIDVVRADSDPASNYIICSRICQQMQIADLVIVDVSTQNPNVFYELGMAVALGKMILPICYSESYYKMVIPEKVKKHIDCKMLEHHIDCYPWRKKLFEYYGIRYKRGMENENADQKNARTHYLEYEKAISIQYEFSDMQYSRFPYHEKIYKAREDVGKDKANIGQEIYEKLRNQYNNANERNNTLVVYTMDGFLNKEQAGTCIVNFYHDITARMRYEKCFSGDRVGVLVQGNVIPEKDKDTREKLNLFYSVGEIIHIGVNQATYLAAENKLKTDDFMPLIPENELENSRIKQTDKITRMQADNIVRYVKGHIRNRGLLIYPNNPVYVSRVKSEIHGDVLDNELQRSNEVCNCSNMKAFSLYHVMLKTLRYTNQIVVDISDNCLQSLFWLGVAHGSDIYAITVLHEQTEEERKEINGLSEKKARNVFDVAGLWTAILRSNDTDGFYNQLALAQEGIENHSKLMVKSKKEYQKRLQENWEVYGKENKSDVLLSLYKEEKEAKNLALESYYRNRFWSPMLRYNKLTIYLPQAYSIDTSNQEPKGYTSKWDFEAISLLSNYLSKRTVIGEYKIKALDSKEPAEDAPRLNYITIGEDVHPLGQKLQDYIWQKIRDNNGVLHKQLKINRDYSGCKKIYKGFVQLNNENKGIFTQHTQAKCSLCIDGLNCNICNHQVFLRNIGGVEDKYIYDICNIEKCPCQIIGCKEHIEIGQLILWREDSDSLHERSYFRVALTGSSGPATLALAAIFVGEEQKEEFFKIKDNHDEGIAIEYKKILLCELQEKVRCCFMEEFKKDVESMLRTELKYDVIKQSNIDKKEENIPRIERYIALVKYTISSYLSTVLYRYFLPFLSERDINRIYYGMYTFINSMRIDKESPFAEEASLDVDPSYSTVIEKAAVQNIIKNIPELLISLLERFRGIEAFYEVRVKHNAESTDANDGKANVGEDNRKVIDIKMKESHALNCLILPKNKEEP